MRVMFREDSSSGKRQQSRQQTTQLGGRGGIALRVSGVHTYSRCQTGED